MINVFYYIKFKYEILYWYFYDFIQYSPDDIDNCCRR